MSRLLEMLPKYERDSEVFKEIMKAEEIELDKLDLDIEDLQKQFFIDTATWGLVIYEKDLEIKTNLNKPLEERRGVIKSKLRGTGKVDATLIKMVADAYTNGDVDVRFDGNILVKFNSVLGIPSNLNDVENAISEISPAHLAIIYKFAYLLIKDIDKIMTITELNNTKLNKFAGRGE